MSDYPNISLLSALDETTPTIGTAPVSELDDAIRQIKSFLKAYMPISHADGGALKDGAVTAGMLADGAVTETKLGALAVTAAKLAVDSVETAKIKNGAVTVDKLATGGVATAGLADGSVTTEKLAAAAVTTTKLGPFAVTDAILKSSSTDSERAVTTDHIRDAAVTNAKLGAGAVTPAKITLAGTNVMLFKGASLQEVQLGGVVQMDSIDTGTSPPTLKLKFVAGQETGETEYFRVEERAAVGTHAGASVASTWNLRNVHWMEASDPFGAIIADNQAVYFNESGSWMVRIIVPGYSCGIHRARLLNVSNGNTKLYGTVASASPGNVTHSVIQGLVAVSLGEIVRVDHWTELSVASNGLGIAAGIAGAQELYSIFEAWRA